MEHREKLQNKFSLIRQGVTSPSPRSRSKSIKMGQTRSTNKTKLQAKNQNCSRVQDKKHTAHVSRAMSREKQGTDSRQTPSLQTILSNIQLQLSTLNSTLKHLPLSSNNEINTYYQIVKEFVKQMVHNPLYDVFKLVHSIYTIPLPTLISRADISSKIYSQQWVPVDDDDDLFAKSRGSIKSHLNSGKDSRLFTTGPTSRAEDYQQKTASKCSKLGIKLNMKLDMNKIQETRENVKDYHDEFYSNIMDFSQSWRDQALKERH